MQFAAVAVKNLRRRPARTVLTCLGIALAVSAVVVLVGAAQTFEDLFADLYKHRGADLVIQRGGGNVQLNSAVSQKIGPKIAQLENVERVVGGLMDLIAFPDNNMFAVIVNGWPADSPVLKRVDLISGRMLQATDHRGVMLGKELAANLHKQAGDSIEIYSKQFEVVGIFDSFSRLESGAVFLLLPELQQLIDRPGQVTGYVVLLKTHDSAAIADAKRRIEALDPSILATPSGEFVHNIRQISIYRSAAWILSAIALAIGAIGVLNTMLMTVFERSREIGALRAMGWRKSRVVAMLLGESCILTFVGAAGGILGGAGLLKLLSQLPTTSNLMDGRLPGLVVWQALVVALAAGLIGALYPAIHAARLCPVEALRR